MAKCDSCGKTIVLGGTKGDDGRFCSVPCRASAFFPRFQAAMAESARDQPPPEPAPAADAGPEAEVAPVADGFKDLVVILLGLAVAASVVVVLYAVLSVVKYPFHQQTVWFVLPVGASLCGLAAGCGFWAALRRFNRLPTRGTYASALLGGVAGYLLIYVLMWWMLDLGGGLKARDRVSFPDYLRFVVENQRVHMGRAKAAPIDLGRWGYARFAINVVGFALGMTACVAIGGGRAYCRRCRRYLVTVGTQARASSDPEAVGSAMSPIIAALAAGRVQEAVDLHAGSADPGANGYFTSTIAVLACPGCGVHLATFSASTQGEQGPNPVPNFTFLGSSPEPVLV